MVVAGGEGVIVLGGGVENVAGESLTSVELGVTGVIAVVDAGLSTIDGNCTRWPQAGNAAANSHETARRPRKRQAVRKAMDFKLGTEC